MKRILAFSMIVALVGCGGADTGAPFRDTPIPTRFQLFRVGGQPAPTVWNSADDLIGYSCYAMDGTFDTVMLLSQTLEFTALHDSVTITTSYTRRPCNGFTPGIHAKIDTVNDVQRRASRVAGDTIYLGVYPVSSPHLMPFQGRPLVRVADTLGMRWNPPTRSEFEYRKSP